MWVRGASSKYCKPIENAPILNEMRRGVPIVLSAASGTGKTTLGHRLIQRFGDIKLSVSYTTRPPRGGEQDGVDYHFVSTTQFEDMVRSNAFIEWAQVHGNLYGTAFSEVTRRVEVGEDVLLDIDVQGGKSIKERIPDSLLVFLLPPSMSELRRRLSSRGTESTEQVQIRLLNARREIEAAAIYDYLIVNDDLERAAEALSNVVINERLRRADKTAIVRQILTDA
jgi:guanylate kinase